MQRISEVGALDRLTLVCEVTSSTQPGQGERSPPVNRTLRPLVFLTAYKPDPMGNLLAVSKGSVHSAMTACRDFYAPPTRLGNIIRFDQYRSLLEWAVRCRDAGEVLVTPREFHSCRISPFVR